MAHFIDWYDQLREHPDRWVNHGRRIAEESCKHKTQDKDNMMNYGYPLCCLPDDEKILQIVKQTCLTVMENQDTGEIFLVLCGGGMDLSQSIAYAYLLAGYRIPDELVFEVCTQPCLSVGKKTYRKIMRQCRKELKDIRLRALFRSKQITQALRDFHNGNE